MGPSPAAGTLKPAAAGWRPFVIGRSRSQKALATSFSYPSSPTGLVQLAAVVAGCSTTAACVQ